MANVNHCNRFFKKVDELHKMSSGWGHPDYDDNDVRILRTYSHECEPKDCFLRPDGMWESYPESYGRYMRKFIFAWRIHPNYCCAGKPYFNWSQQKEFMDKSETDKVLYEYNGYEFVLYWYELTPPNHIVWGMKMGKTYFGMRYNGEHVMLPTRVKKRFREDAQKFIVASDYTPPERGVTLTFDDEPIASYSEVQALARNNVS